MSCCGDKNINTTWQPAKAVLYEGDLPTFTEIDPKPYCLDTETVINDIYSLLKKLQMPEDFESSLSDCNCEAPTIPELLIKLDEAIGTLQKQTEDEQGEDDWFSQLDMKCLTDSCDNQITSKTIFFQTIIDEICALK